MEDGVKSSGILLLCSKRRSRINSSMIDREIGNSASDYLAFLLIIALWSRSTEWCALIWCSPKVQKEKQFSFRSEKKGEISKKDAQCQTHARLLLRMSMNRLIHEKLMNFEMRRFKQINYGALYSWWDQSWSESWRQSTFFSLQLWLVLYIYCWWADRRISFLFFSF